MVLGMNKKERAKELVKFLKKRYSFQVEKYRKRNRFPFRTLIACVLSQRTREENTKKAYENLFSVAKTPEKILRLSERRIQELIKPSGPYRQKAKRIKEICKILIEKYGGKVPKTREELLSLPGVGFKTADVTLCYGFGVPRIPVDTHVFRIPKRIGLVEMGKNVEEARETLEGMISEKDRYIVNLGLVSFGREICKPIRPLCEKCELSGICDYYKKSEKIK
jgi:endonuclease-3